eukprot:COSAG06_NODE_2369_length_6995_cov_7.327001_5_plen_83_part_00
MTFTTCKQGDLLTDRCRCCYCGCRRCRRRSVLPLCVTWLCRERTQAKKEADAKREQEAAEEKKRLEEQAAETGDLSILGLLG